MRGGLKLNLLALFITFMGFPPAIGGEMHFFVIGAFVQPVHMMDLWKTRGINTLVGVPEGHDSELWSAEAVARDLYMIRSPAPDAATDTKEDHLLAWLHFDEPSNVAADAPGVDIEHVAVTPAEIDDVARAWRLAGGEGRTIPLFLNLTGAHVNDAWINAPLMADYVDGNSTDMVAHDYYTINIGAPMLYELDGYTTTRQGRAIDRLSEWSGGKPQFVFIESSDYDRNGSVPTAGEMRAQIWSSIIHGAVGIIYFPVAFQPWSFDETPDELLTEMSTTHAMIDELEGVILDPATGQPNGTLHRMAPQGVVPEPGMMPYPFEARSYQTPHGQFQIILNLSPDGLAVLKDPSGSAPGLEFGPYEIKVGYWGPNGFQESLDPALPLAE
ncbi:hypothetical protein [Pelagibacterium sp. H642]|uniref:hypothetical protein n=1 Tax=Pelagibacterium sp. H642 TaxID=1881069 RepID=UPI002815368F|nr:hypothetical protein [Pelagibacterium sp. H642]WMT92823.1 hypothetical protein NO934_18755 [Pelagibacterium sp. H642]